MKIWIIKLNPARVRKLLWRSDVFDGCSSDVMPTDMVTPTFGKYHLEDFFERADNTWLANKRRNATNDHYTKRGIQNYPNDRHIAPDIYIRM